jgi:hypothetical protein
MCILRLGTSGFSVKANEVYSPKFSRIYRRKAWTSNVPRVEIVVVLLEGISTAMAFRPAIGVPGEDLERFSTTNSSGVVVIYSSPNGLTPTRERAKRPIGEL